MGTHRLICHEDTPSRAVSGIVVELRRVSAGGIDLSFIIEDSHFLELPPPAHPARRDGLWQVTCLELFVRSEKGHDYREFNFAPSGEWAAYTFDAYREGMRNLPIDQAPRIAATLERDRFILDVTLPEDALPPEPSFFGLSAIIVEQGDVRSYWALAHAPDKPDFHHAACFAARLPAPEEA